MLKPLRPVKAVSLMSGDRPRLEPQQGTRNGK